MNAIPLTLLIYETTRLSLLAEYRRAADSARAYHEKGVAARERGDLGAVSLRQALGREWYEVAWAYRDVVLALDAEFRDVLRAERARVRRENLLKHWARAGETVPQAWIYGAPWAREIVP